jgi:hypothetical protein
VTLPKELQNKWDEAAANQGTIVPVGRTVVCDLCDADCTDSAVSGGFIFESKGVCPACAPRFLATIRKYNEESFIKARCPEGKPFADFIRDYRGPNAGIRITGFK